MVESLKLIEARVHRLYELMRISGKVYNDEDYRYIGIRLEDKSAVAIFCNDNEEFATFASIPFELDMLTENESEWQMRVLAMTNTPESLHKQLELIQGAIDLLS